MLRTERSDICVRTAFDAFGTRSAVPEPMMSTRWRPFCGILALGILTSMALSACDAGVEPATSSELTLTVTTPDSLTMWENESQEWSAHGVFVTDPPAAATATVRVVSAPAFMRMERVGTLPDRFQIETTGFGAGEIVLAGTAPGHAEATAKFPVAVWSACPLPPTGFADYLPLENGTWRFDYVKAEYNWTGGSSSTAAGELALELSAVTCARGVLSGQVREVLQASNGTWVLREGAFSHTADGMIEGLLDLSLLPGARIPRYLPASSPDVETVPIGSTGRLRVERDRGILGFSYEVWGGGNRWTLRMDRLDEAG